MTLHITAPDGTPIKIRGVRSFVSYLNDEGKCAVDVVRSTWTDPHGDKFTLDGFSSMIRVESLE